MNARFVAEPLVAIENLTVRLPEGGDRLKAVDGIDLDIAPGRILCVVGESGSGKSMTAHAIMGLVPKPLISTGAIRFDGENLIGLAAEKHRAIRGRRIGMIFQEPMAALNPVMRVGRQIEEVFRFHDVPGPYDERVVKLLGDMGLPEPELLRHAFPFSLSGGQRQRVMIAMALALDPELLIADEPTTALDVTTQKQILALLKRAQAERGMGIVLITHDFGVVAEIGDEVAVMQHGKIVERGTVAEVLGNPGHDYTRTLLAAVPKLAKRPAVDRPGGKPLLSAKGVTKTYSSRTGLFGPRRTVEAVRDAGFSLARGQTLGIVGESGSGKSTLARIIVRLLTADAGDVRLAGVERNLLDLGSRDLAPLRRRVQMVFQDPFASLNPRRTVFEIVAQGLLAHGMSRADARRRVAELLDLVALDPASARRYPNAFSGGQRQRIGIARALALEPDVIVADEPVSALDVSIQARVLDLLADLQRRLSLGMLFITHDLRVAAQVCDHVAVMQRGRIVEMGPSADVLFKPSQDYTKLLIDSIPGRGAFAAPASGASAN
ncbi:dipeptide ABC transporter ATP-binding protein [Nitratireductor sp. CAU 1489]|uniref:Dipeptide ABC transporter ATP-binding protein n=1 Tax=Nitratireductor arenosus TaxID=2682096 RepID=A0A844QJ88_9HYPH|nr:ABC transporter ATP-binding protein [Nitratireductor arenosus]MVA98664.1 dipeptide ABC transporter ATP-binding protein [Nitratireductor arenosus]